MRRAALIALLLAARPALAQSAPAGAPAGDPSPVPAQPGHAAPAPGAPPAAGPPPAQGAVPRAPRPHPRRWFLIPVLSYLPETGLGGGASAGLHLPVEGARRPTSLFATALYTAEHQGLLDLAVESARPGGAVLAARGRALHFPDRYYGIGPGTTSAQVERFTRRSIELSATAELPVPLLAGLRAGPRVELRAEEITDRQAGGQLAAGAVPGAHGSSYGAGGISVTWDTRDGTFWPSRGSLVQAWAVYAPAATSRLGELAHGSIELRHFIPLGGGRVLGLHAYGEQAGGETPFTVLPRLGNTRILRGIREGRYRDRVSWATQSELRSPLWWRFSWTAFAAVGNVAPRPRAIRLDDPKLAGGAGLRYRLTEEGANIRMDVAASRFGVQLYVLVLEAF